VGPVLYYPSATNLTVGVNRWGSGPSAAFVHEDESPWVFGVVVNNIWSFGGPPNSSDRTNQLLLNPIVSYYFGEGWSVGLVAEYSDELDRKWGQMDRPGRRRLRQGDEAGRTIGKTGAGRLLRCHTAQGRQRHLATAGHTNLSVSGLDR
jgi:hypothetical protein